MLFRSLIILSGTVRVYRDTTEYPVSLPEEQRPAVMSETVSADDREPIVGFASCLGDDQWDTVCNRTADWVVHALTYVDTAWVARNDIINCFQKYWPKGQWEMIEVAKFHYEVDVKTLAETEAAAAADGAVELDGDVSKRIDTLNIQLCDRIAKVERKVDQKLDTIIEQLRGLSATAT